MKTSKIVIKNLFGIRETTLDGKSVEISGPKGAGKTSVLDAIRFALTNRSERDCIVHQGADEGEIIIETTTGLSIDRKALPAKSAGTVKVRDGSLLQTRPAEFLSQIFTPLQLNPVEFTQLSRQEKNRVILSLIEFDWDVNWIREQFGEIPQGVDYSKHILEVLNDIQAENGVYFQSRQNINRDIRNKQAFISDIAKDIPSGYDYDRWNQYPIGDRYRELERLREKNSVIERAKAFRANFTSKLRGLEGSRDVEIGAIDRDIAAERAALTGSIERMKAELQATEEKLAQLSRRRQDRVDIATANFEAAKAKLEKDVGVAEQYADQEPVDTTALAAEVNLQLAGLADRDIHAQLQKLAVRQIGNGQAVDQRDSILHGQTLHGDMGLCQDGCWQLTSKFNLAGQLSRLVGQILHLGLHGHHTLVLVQMLPHLLGIGTAMTSREPSTSTLRATCYPLFWPSAPRRRSPISLPCTLMTRIWPLLWRL